MQHQLALIVLDELELEQSMIRFSYFFILFFFIKHAPYLHLF